MRWTLVLLLLAPPAMASGDARIFFGHQSVGENLIAGLKAAAPSLKIVETRSAIDGPGLYHAKVGKNEAPLTKLEDFERIVNELGPQLDVALVKLCYVDFNATTDADALATAYLSTLERLEQKFPNVKFVRVTAPLTTVQGGAKGVVKRLLGKPSAGEAENAKRQQFNERLRAASRGKPLFDLAKLESQQADGATLVDGKGTPALVPSDTDDGGHLNAAAQRRLGKALYELLSSL